jgi:hypothetical protein
MKFFRKVLLPVDKQNWAFKNDALALEAKEWCRTTLGRQVVGGNWWTRRNYIYFNDEKCYAMYMLKFQ